jgi:acyl-CoA thioesterase I
MRIKNHFSFLIFAVFAAAQAVSQTLTVPDIGSVWINRVVYLSSGREQAPEVIRVTRMQAGRPVFAGETFGYQGEIMESSVGTLISTQDCLSSIPPEQLLPPAKPNQCSWGVCDAPEVGQTYERPIYLYAALYGCKVRTGTYRFKATGKAKSESEAYRGEVTVGEAEMSFGLFARTRWESHIAPGIGEVFSRSQGRETRYDKVEVNLVAYKADASVRPFAAAKPIPEASADLAKMGCDIVAFGDSLTEGMGVRHDQCYPALLEGLAGMKVCNFGNTGNTSDVGVLRLGEVISAKPRLVIVLFGANDALQGVSGSVIQGNLEKMVDGLHAAGIDVLLGGLRSQEAVRTVPAWRELISIHDSVVKPRPWLRHIPDVTQGVIGRAEMTSSDALHPNAAGYAKVAQTIWEQGVQPWLTEQRNKPVRQMRGANQRNVCTP